MSAILVVDDEDGVREYLAEVLSSDGHRVAQAADGAAALELLKRERFDLLLSDLRMPKLDGLGLLRAARSVAPDLNAIMLSAHGTVESAVEAMKLGALDFLEKPIRSPASLRAVVRGACRVTVPPLDGTRPAPKTAGPVLTFGAPAMQQVIRDVDKVATTQATVLLLGESGSGKEVLAREIHRLSPRASGPFVAINCAALSETLIESELFGHERGAFTGAHERREGRLEQAEGGTFFLDEIAELKPELQVKLLRVLQERCFERVGGNQTIACDVRWVAATHRDLPARVDAGTFRADLFYRLSVFPIQVPPLRERRQDIVPLATMLLEQIALGLGRPGLKLDEEAERALVAHAWPGNVRELRNVLERAAIVAEAGAVRAADLNLQPGAPQVVATSGALSLEDAEVSVIRSALAIEGGHRKRAADRLGIGLRTLYEKIKRYRL
jgi:two-component system response regulator AtoC